MSIKDEMQGDGYIKIVRNKYLPNSKEMSDLGFNRYVSRLDFELTPEYIINNADDVLRDLFIAETEIFVERSQEIVTSVLPFYYNEIYKKDDAKYPETSRAVEKLESLYNSIRNNQCTASDFIATVSRTVTPIIDDASFSQKQSAKSRVGNTLQNQLQKMFEICSFPFEVQQRQEDGETIMDFVIPNLASCSIMPDQVINIECQTTLKDRFRLTTGKTTDARVRRYLATMTGLGIVNNKDKKDITTGKLKEIIVKNNVTLIVHRDARTDALKKIDKELDKLKKQKDKSVEVKELTHLKNLCQNKLISYHDLFNRDIKAVLTYWNN